MVDAFWKGTLIGIAAFLLFRLLIIIQLAYFGVDRLLELLEQTVPIYIGNLVARLLIVFCAGYVSSRLAKSHSYVSTTVMAAILLAIGFSFSLFLRSLYGPDEYSPIWVKLFPLYVFPVALFGAWCWRRQTGERHNLTNG